MLDAGFEAKYAVDGAKTSLDSYFHSAKEANPWIYVDLGAADQRVSSVTWYQHPTNVGCNQQMLSSIGSCGDKLNAAEYPEEGTKIGVSNTIPSGSDLWGGVVCRHITLKAEVPNVAQSVTAVCPEDAAGRYVYLQAPGTGRVIIAMELVIQLQFPGLLAGYGVSTSSIDVDAANCAASPYAVVDGVTARGYGISGSLGMACTAGSGEVGTTNPWIAVDLGGVSTVTTLVLFGHADAVCDIRLLTESSDCLATAAADHEDRVYDDVNQGSNVGVSTTPCPSAGGGLCGGVVCKVLQTRADVRFLHADGFFTVQCPPGTQGRYVYVQALGKGGGPLL